MKNENVTKQCSQRLQQAVCTLAHGVVDNTDGTDCWRLRTGGKQSVMAGVSRRSNQNSAECGERIVGQTALGSVTVWQTAQQIDSTVFVSRITHSTHCMNSKLGVSPRFTVQRWSRDPQSHDCKQVELGRKLGRRRANAAQPRRAAHAHTGTNSNWHEYICKYVNQRPYRIL